MWVAVWVSCIDKDFPYLPKIRKPNMDFLSWINGAFYITCILERKCIHVPNEDLSNIMSQWCLVIRIYKSLFELGFFTHTKVNLKGEQLFKDLDIRQTNLN